MATAIENTILCERCNTQISLHDWPWHSRQCSNGEKRQKTEHTERNDMEVPTVQEDIPCEYCQNQINLNDWESHSKQCADAHKRRVENLRNGIDDEEPTTTNIPCEYCNESISIHNWEWHSRQCVNTNKNDTNNIPNNNRNESGDPLIPCEYCGVPISIHELTWHTKECADTEHQQLAKIAKEDQNDEKVNLIPCEYCGKHFALQFIQDHETACRRQQMPLEFQPDAPMESGFGGLFSVPKHWDQTSLYNLSQHILEPDSEEYRFVEEKFHKSLPNNKIVQIERIQNRRWFRQYEAHKDDFIERYGKSTEQWLFHGCKSKSTEAIINDCFNRSHAVRCAVGQGIYFATDASTSLSYTQPDANNHRHMFMARVLVGKTTGGNQATRVCPPGYDTTGGGTVFVTYHDAQAYGEYLITFS